MRASHLTLGMVLFLSLCPAAIAQGSAAQSRSAPDFISKQDADAETEFQKTVADAGDDRAALVRNLKAYLLKFPEAPRRVAIFRALVEACEQLRDNACALEYAERLIAVEPNDVGMMMLAVNLLQSQGDDASLERAGGYVNRVLDRVRKSNPNARPARLSLAEWQEHLEQQLAALYFLRGRIEKSQRNYQAATKDLQRSNSILPNSASAELLGEIAELQKDSAAAIEEYALAFVLPETGPMGKVDRLDVRRKLGNAWRQVHGSDQGLGEKILSTYDHLAGPAAHADPAARNKNAKDAFGFVLRRLDGTPAPMGPFKGKIVALSFWATWCEPCHELEPLFSQVARSYAGNPGVAFLAVDTDEDESGVPDFVAREKWGVPVVFSDGLDEFLKVSSLPTVILLNGEGKIIFRVNGFDPDGFSPRLTTAVQNALNPQN
jgi:cytochrome c biogenesis protein CcmG/thiol:disulfide interchange protein DsbE